MPLPLVARNLLANVAWQALGLRERTALHPLAACFLVTYRCELRCTYCLENVRHRCPDGTPRELDTAGVVRVLRALREVCDAIDLSGGEPLLRPDLPFLLGVCRDLGFREVMLNTNALHLPDDPAFLDDVDCVMVGTDTVREPAFLRITGGSAEQFARQRAALERLCELRSTRRFDLNVCAVMIPGMLDEVEPLCDWCFERGVGLLLSPWIDRDLRVHEALRRDPAWFDLCRRLLAHRRAGRPLAATLGYHEALCDLRPHRCLPMANLTVDPLGRMCWPCGEIQHPGPSFLERRSFPEMVAAARARWGPLPDCRDRCHFVCRYIHSDWVNRPWRLPAELRHLRSCRRTG